VHPGDPFPPARRVASTIPRFPVILNFPFFLRILPAKLEALQGFCSPSSAPFSSQSERFQEVISSFDRLTKAISRIAVPLSYLPKRKTSPPSSFFFEKLVSSVTSSRGKREACRLWPRQNTSGMPFSNHSVGVAFLSHLRTRPYLPDLGVSPFTKR